MKIERIKNLDLLENKCFLRNDLSIALKMAETLRILETLKK